METLLIALLVILAPYPLAGLVFGVLLAMGFYAAAVAAAITRLTADLPNGQGVGPRLVPTRSAR
ncbi:hypothetical protein [Reyranella sp.]|uniref:hypothetical protein n=1 Tax=Reyranella sp. TaxID=1929291 RepID=UPI003D0A6341